MVAVIFDEELRRVLFDRGHFVDEDFIASAPKGALRGAQWTAVESRFERCYFAGLRAEFSFGAGRAVTEYVDCSFDRAMLTSTVPGRATFVRCSFREVRLRKWICQQAEFIDCVFSGD